MTDSVNILASLEEEILQLRTELQETYRGITELTNELNSAHEAVRRAHAELEQVFDTTGDGLCLIDLDFNIIRTNKRYLRLVGASQEEVVGRKCFEVFGGRACHYPVCRLSRILAGEKQVEEDDEKICSAGGSVPCIITAAPFYDPKGQLIGIVENIKDITARKRAEEALKQSEQKFRELIDSLPVTVFEADAQSNITYLNRLGMDKLGYKKREKPGGLNFIDLVAPEDRNRAREDLLRGLNNQAIDGVEYTIQLRDGKSLPILLHMVPVTDQDQVIGFRGICQDLSDPKRAEEEKRRLESQLRQAQKMEAIGTLAGGIAHDFNNILAAIIGYTELTLAELPKAGPARHGLEQVLKAAERATDLVKQILTFSRQTEGQRKPLKVTPVIKEALKFLRSSLPSNIEIRQDLRLESDTVLADPTQIYQVVMNLCANAAQAMKDKDGLLEVALVEVDLSSEPEIALPGLSAGKHLRLNVRDTGHGMDKATVERIFEPFFTTKDLGEGTGMGLAVVHGIVQSHAGAINVDSQPGVGTTFQVYLPKIEEKAPDEAKVAVSLPRGAEKILLVDDEAPLVDIERQMLETLGYEVVARTSSLEALEAFRFKPEQFDLVITDQTMPNMIGLDLARNIFNIRPEVPIILCTGFSQTVTPEQAGKIGIQGFLMKPMGIHDLAVTVRQVLDQKDSARESKETLIG